MKLKEDLISLIEKSGLSNKEVVSALDEIRKNYHDRRNVGEKGISEKELSELEAKIHNETYPISKDKKYVFYKGGWRKVYGSINKSIRYLQSDISVKFINK